MTVRITNSCSGDYNLTTSGDFSKTDVDDLLAKYRLSHGQKLVTPASDAVLDEEGNVVTPAVEAVYEDYTDQEMWNAFTLDLVTWTVSELTTYRKLQQIAELPPVSNVEFTQVV